MKLELESTIANGEFLTQNPIFIRILELPFAVPPHLSFSLIGSDLKDKGMIKVRQVGDLNHSVWEGELILMRAAEYKIDAQMGPITKSMIIRVGEQPYLNFASHMIPFSTLLIVALMFVFIWVKKIKKGLI